jgi:hypothetical protein
MISSPVVAGATAFAQDYNNLRTDILNLSLFEAVVAPTGADYSTLGAALAAGKKRIFIRAGTYSESAISSSADDIYLIGENQNTVILQTTAAGMGSIGFSFSGNRPVIKDLILRGTNAITTEKVVQLTGDRPYFDNVRVDKGKSILIDGNSMASNALFQNIYVDATSLDTGGGVVFQGFGVYGSKIVNSFIFAPSTASVIVFNSCNFQIVNSLLRGNKLQIICLRMTNSIIQSGNTILNGDFVNNTVSDYSYSPGTTPFVQLANGIFVANMVSVSYNPAKILKIDGAFSTVTGNKLSYGKDIEISGEGVVFCNNTWLSPFLPQQMDIKLTATAVRCQVNHNIVKGEASSMPATITDLGKDNKKIDNQLYI